MRKTRQLTDKQLEPLKKFSQILSQLVGKDDRNDEFFAEIGTSKGNFYKIAKLQNDFSVSFLILLSHKLNIPIGSLFGEPNGYELQKKVETLEKQLETYSDIRETLKEKERTIKILTDYNEMLKAQLDMKQTK